MTKREQDLKALFEEWSSCHKKEVETEMQTWYEETIDTIKRKDSFIPDGFLGADEESQKVVDYIFINRESNSIQLWDSSDSNAMDFWMRRNCIESTDKCENKKEQSISRRQATKYRNVMRKCIKEIKKREGSELEEDKISLNNCAYVNLNKRGGNNSLVNNKQRLSVFRNYITDKNYSEFLKKEIEIIINTEKPKIVILGKFKKNEDIDNEILNIMRNFELEMYRYEYHPSAWKCYKGELEELK